MISQVYKTPPPGPAGMKGALPEQKGDVGFLGIPVSRVPLDWKVTSVLLGRLGHLDLQPKEQYGLEFPRAYGREG